MTSNREDPIKDPSAFTALTKIHKHSVSQCAFSPDTDQILSGSEDKTLVLWNLPSRDIQLHDNTINDEHKLTCYRLSDHQAPIISVSIHSKYLLSASKDGHVKLWRLQSQHHHQAECHSRNLSSIHRHRHKPPSSISSHTSERPLPFKQPRPEACTYLCSTRIIRSVEFSHDARSFTTGSDDRSVRIWSTECKNKSLGSYLDGHTNWIKTVRWAKLNPSLLASCGDDGKVCIWDTRNNFRQAPVIQLSSKRKMQFNCLDWHPIFEHHFATGSQDSTCAVWDIRNKKQIQIYADHNGSINSLAFNSGGSLLLTGSSDRTSKIYDVCQGTNLFTLMSHSGPVTSVCFNSDDELFATASRDSTVTVWKRNFDILDIELADEDEESTNITDNDGQSSGFFNDDIGHHEQQNHFESEIDYRSHIESHSSRNRRYV